MRATIRVFADVARNRGLRLVVVAFAAFIVTEYAVWIAMLVYAFEHGGLVTSGLVALAQLVPAAMVAPLVAPMADRRSPVLVLAGGYVVQSAGMTSTAVFVLLDTPLPAYLSAVVASTAVTLTRPAQAALVPALTHEVKELTAANAVFGWVESISVLVSGGGVGLALALGSTAAVFGAGAVLLAAATWLVFPLHRVVRRGTVTASVDASHPLREGIAEVWGSPAARLLVSLIGAEYVVIGALDLLFVVMAVDVLHAGQPWVGYLNMAYGAGGVLVGGAAVLLVGRRLGPVILATAVGLSVALALAAFAPTPVTAAVLLMLVGGGHALFDFGTRSLLQRAVAADMVARIFGLAEGLSMAGLAVGSVLAPALVALAGGRLALVGVALVLPALVLARARMLQRLDQHARVPIVEISLLRSLTLFRDLPGPALEGLAHALERLEWPDGAVVIHEGDEGDRYYVLVDGAVVITRGDRTIRTLGRGEGMGEIALLRSGRRTATAVASGPVTAYALDRAAFLTAVNGHVPTLESASRLVGDLRAEDARRDGDARD